MAGVVLPEDAVVVSGVSLNRLARRQFAALIAMRWRMTVNGVRSVQGAFEFGARGVAYIIYSIMGLSLGVGLGAGAYQWFRVGIFSFSRRCSGPCSWCGRRFPSRSPRFRNNSI